MEELGIRRVGPKPVSPKAKKSQAQRVDTVKNWNISLNQGRQLRGLMLQMKQIQIQKMSQYPQQLRCLFYLVFSLEGGVGSNAMLYYLDSNAICTCLLLKFVSPISVYGSKEPQRGLCQQDKRQLCHESWAKALQAVEFNTTRRVCSWCSYSEGYRWQMGGGISCR